MWVGSGWADRQGRQLLRQQLQGGRIGIGGYPQRQQLAAIRSGSNWRETALTSLLVKVCPAHKKLIIAF